MAGHLGKAKSLQRLEELSSGADFIPKEEALPM
jgi:hypothetical protein